jgi:hypothetical protein
MAYLHKRILVNKIRIQIYNWPTVFQSEYAK